MTLVMRCDEKDRLIAYLYGEDSAVDRAAVEAHVARCTPCAAELAALRDLRGLLGEWQTPEGDLGFRVVREPVVAAPPRRRWPLPVWAQAAAAVLVIGAGLGLANLDVRYGSDGIAIRTGWQAPPSAAEGAVPAASPIAAPTRDAGTDAWQRALADTESRLRAEFALAAAAPQPVSPAPAVRGDDLLRQVRSLIDESERRQQKELALRLTQLVRDVEAQRRADLVRIEQNMGQIEGVTGAEAARQRELLNYLVRVSQRR